MAKYTLVCSDDNDCYAMYQFGRKVAEGDGFGDFIDQAQRYFDVQIKIVEDEILYCGEENESPPDLLSEIEDYEKLPEWEREARELEAQAAALRKREGRGRFG